MAKAKNISAQNGIVFNERIVVSDHTSKISEYASDKKFDLIVMGSRGMSPVKELFLGSVQAVFGYFLRSAQAVA